jgi:ABC-type spermidine/putrescine transport system permease subunit I
VTNAEREGLAKSGIQRRVRTAVGDGTGAGWLLALPFAFLLVFLAAPLVLVVTTSISELGVGGFLDTITGSLFVDAVKRTALLALVVTAICWPLAVIYSIALVLAPRWLRVFLFVSLLVTFWISLLVRTYGWVLLLQPAGALDKLLMQIGVIHEPTGLLGTGAAMYPAMVHVMLPFAVLPILAALREVDPRQLRAAQSLGATPSRVLRTVILPAMRSGSVAACTLVFIISLGFFVTPAFLGGPGSLTIATLIDRQFSTVFETGSAAAMGTTLIVVVLGIYFLSVRLFKVDLKAGGTS